MIKKEQEKRYPLRTLHEFLSELNREWRSFKRGTLATLVLLSISLVAVVPLFFRAIRFELDIFAYVFLIGLGAFLIYLIRIMVTQYRFFRKWGYRLEQLVNLEEKLMGETFEGKASEQHSRASSNL
jgi:hypothetical protein